MSTKMACLLLFGAAATVAEGYQTDKTGVGRGWSRVPSVGTKALPKVSGHSVAGWTLPPPAGMEGVEPRRAALLFGGLTGPAGSPCTDETWMYVEGGAAGWMPLDGSIEGPKPRVRMYPACAVAAGKMYLFGGWDPAEPGSGGEFLDDVWEFDPEAAEWTELDAKLPFPASRHTACAIDESTIVIHTHKGTFSFDSKTGTLTEVETTGDGPVGFSMCASSPLGGSRMLVFGGSTRTQEMSSDAYVLDATDWTWTKLGVVGGDGADRPPAVASSAAAPVSDDEVLVFGGASIGASGYEGGFGLIPLDDTWLLKVDGETATWTKVEPVQGAAKPDGRVAATLSPIGPSSFLLQGGYDPLKKTTFDEPWVIEL